jgi:hypothetical protein
MFKITVGNASRIVTAQDLLAAVAQARGQRVIVRAL